MLIAQSANGIATIGPRAVRREEDDPISTVDIPYFKLLSNSCDLVNKAVFTP